MTSRLATDDEVDTWREHGWVLLDGLVGADDIDAAAEDLHRSFPTAEEYDEFGLGLCRDSVLVVGYAVEDLVLT